jgi:hypothetical protein
MLAGANICCAWDRADDVAFNRQEMQRDDTHLIVLGRANGADRQSLNPHATE